MFSVCQVLASPPDVQRELKAHLMWIFAATRCVDSLHVLHEKTWPHGGKLGSASNYVYVEW